MQLAAESQRQHLMLFLFSFKSVLPLEILQQGHTAVQKWGKARRKSLDKRLDLAVVLNAEDKAFLTNMTFQFVQQHPQENSRDRVDRVAGHGEGGCPLLGQWKQNSKNFYLLE